MAETNGKNDQVIITRLYAAVANKRRMPDGPRKPAEAMASTEFAKELDVVVKSDSESESSKNESLKRTSVLGTLTGS